MADASKVWVKATSRGQLPDGTWKTEESPAFRVPRKAQSKRWMREATRREVEQAEALLDEQGLTGDDDGGSVDEAVAELTGKLADAEKRATDAEAARDEVVEKAKKQAEALADANAKVATLEADIVTLKKAAASKPADPPAQKPAGGEPASKA
mgnify:FL=1